MAEALEPDFVPDNNSETDVEAPTPKRSRKCTGAAVYKTKFNKEWSKEFLFVSAVHQDPYRYFNNNNALSLWLVH